MRLPRRPYIYFRFAEKLRGLRGEILLESGVGSAAEQDMSRIAGEVAQLAIYTFWPNGSAGKGLPNRVGCRERQAKPKYGAVLMLWDGEHCTVWTEMTDAALTAIARFATGQLSKSEGA